jgi:DNA-binding MarR family transcriptional regulator
VQEQQGETLESHARIGVAFLLTQLGTHAAGQFAERVAALELTPPQVGMLRMIGLEPGLSQQALSGRLGLLPSKVVSFVDDLEGRGLVARTRSSRDRRVYELTLTGEGEELLRKIRAISAEHESQFCQPLDAEEREQLGSLLRRIAETHGLTPGVHPGYRHIR